MESLRRYNLCDNDTCVIELERNYVGCMLFFLGYPVMNFLTDLGKLAG